MPKNLEKINMRVILFSAILGICLMFPLIGQAVELSLDSSSLQYNIGDTFIINARINVTAPEDINAVEASIQFPSSLLRVKDISIGNSILTFVDSPSFDSQKGIISFAGIIPGGYIGRISGNLGPGGLLVKTVFQVQEAGQGEIKFLSSSRVLLNDGQGTPVQWTGNEIFLTVLEQAQEPSAQQWQTYLKEDQVPPHDFSPVVTKIDNKYYLVFNTKDKESGVAYYAIQEKQLSALSFLVRWRKVASPYLLKDQSLRSVINIKAVDKAGNKRLVLVPAMHPALAWYKDHYIWSIIILGLILLYLAFKKEK